MSLFYESIGPLLDKAARVLEREDGPAAGDERTQRELRQTRTLLRRIGAVWPDLFAALEEEIAILSETHGNTASELRTRGLDVPEAKPCADPLDRYRGLLAALDAAVILLQEHEKEAWAEEATRSLRTGLSAAADVQGRLVDGMLGA
jgi:hypothetical protein